MIDRPRTGRPSNPEALPEVEAEILANVYAFVLEAYESKDAARVPEGLEDGETRSATRTRKVVAS